jgi:hypothetical protein
VRPAAALWVCALVGCAASTTAVAPTRTQTGELESAAPIAVGAGRASTESSARVVLGARRERVRELVDGYLRAVLDGSVAGVTEVFADGVGSIDSNVRYRSATEITEHHRSVMNNYDLAYLRLQLEQSERGPTVRSAAEFRRQWPTGSAAVQQGDWVVELPFVTGAPYASVARYLPFRMVVRFVGAGPKIVAISQLVPVRT